MKKLAADINVGNLQGPGPLGSPGSGSSATDLLTRYLTSVVGLLTAIASIWFVFLVVSGGISLIGSGGDKAAVESAKNRISNGIIGLVVVVLAISLTIVVGRLLGFTEILDLGAIFNRIQL